jgi:hypothetical protein
MPVPALAQVVNGHFDQGVANWTWSDSTYVLAAGTDCSNVPYVPATANSTKVTNKGAAPAAGPVGYLIPPKPYAVGTWGMCRLMEQHVYVPHGAKLTFAARIGDRLSANPPFIQSAGFAVLVDDGTTTTNLYAFSGASRVCDGWSVPCPVYTTRTVDLAPYWGKHVRLIFRGATSGQNTSTSQVFGEPSPVYVDNIRIQ